MMLSMRMHVMVIVMLMLMLMLMLCGRCLCAQLVRGSGGGVAGMAGRMMMLMREGDVEDVSLEQQEATIPIIPYCRKGHAMGIVQDMRGVVVVGGGHDSGGSAGASASGSSGLAGEPRIALFGGKGKDYVAASKGTRALNDAWLLTVNDDWTFDWEMMSPNSEALLPVRRWKANAAEYNGSVYVFGGDCIDLNSNFFGDLWRFSLRPHTQALEYDDTIVDSDDNDDSDDHENDATTTTSTESSTLTTIDGTTAPTNDDDGGANDTPSEGDDGTTVAVQRTAPGWEQVQTTGDPLGRRGHVMTIFSSGRLVIFGGKRKEYDSQNEHLAPCLRDVHYVDLNSTDKEWMQGAEFPKLCRWGATASGIVDPEDGKEKLALFGGRILIKEYEEYVYFNEMWYYNPENDSWAEEFPIRGEIPRPRDHHSSVYLAEMQSLFIYGGRYTYERVPALDDMWQYDLTQHVWTHLVPTTDFVPRSRYMPDMVAWRGVDGTHDPVLLIFGGEHFYDEGDGDNTKLNDVWVFHVNARAWQQVSDGGCKQGAEGVPFQPIVGVGTLAIIAGLVLVAGFILAVVVLARSHIRVRVGGYSTIN